MAILRVADTLSPEVDKANESNQMKQDRRYSTEVKALKWIK